MENAVALDLNAGIVAGQFFLCEDWRDSFVSFSPVADFLNLQFLPLLFDSNTRD